MAEALSFFRALESWIYVILGFGALIFLRRFYLAWQELRGAGFGLERENAQSRLSQATGVLVLILSLVVVEFVLVSFVAPTIPGATPLLTPTLDLFATPSATLGATTPLPGGGQPVSTAALPGAGGPNVIAGCIPGQIEIITPTMNAEISGLVVITGTVNIENFGFYKYETKNPDPSQLNWLTIQAGNEPVPGVGTLGFWDTRRLPPGDYLLRLVVVDNQGQAQAPCTTQVRVAQAAEEAEEP
jgi:hypothetical protein